jgi:hypothetical protein
MKPLILTLWGTAEKRLFEVGICYAEPTSNVPHASVIPQYRKLFYLAV